jgi:hypothetical protein
MVVRTGSVALLRPILRVLPILLVGVLGIQQTNATRHREMTEWDVERDEKGLVTLYEEHPSGIVQLGDALLLNTCVVLSSYIIASAWNTCPFICTLKDVPWWIVYKVRGVCSDSLVQVICGPCNVPPISATQDRLLV